jgi:hypothetical protein
MRKLISTVIVVLVIAGGLFIFRDEAHTVALQLIAHFAPCSSPVTYRIGTIDKKFGMSQSQFLSAIQAGQAIWERGSKRKLLAYDAAQGSVVINLVYDYRQEAIDKLRSIGISIDDTQSSYDQLRVKYDTLHSTYAQRKAALETATADFQRRQDVYNQEVQTWNARGGAPKDIYGRLQDEKAGLNALRVQIQAQEDAFNSDVDTMNALATQLNRLANSLNIAAEKYNTIGASTGSEFEEGVYESSLGKQKIDIYEFSDRSELTRVLAHELGHALGLEHVDDTSAIMYKLNQSSNEHLAPADLSELERVCGASP